MPSLIWPGTRSSLARPPTPDRHSLADGKAPCDRASISSNKSFSHRWVVGAAVIPLKPTIKASVETAKPVASVAMNLLPKFSRPAVEAASGHLLTMSTFMLAFAVAQIVNIEYSEILEADVRGFAAGAPRALSEGYLIRMLQSCLTFTLAVGITMVTSITLVFVPPEGDAFDLWSLAFCWLLVAAALCDVLGLLFFFLGLNAAIFICFPLYSDVRRDAIYNATTGAVLGGTGQLTALDSGGFGLEFFTMPGGDGNATSDDAALPRLSSAYLKGLIFGGFVILCYTLLVILEAEYVFVYSN